MEAVDGLCDLLQTHANRDKLVSLTCYLLKFCGSTTQSKPLLTASARIAAARSCLRLFDDPAVLRSVLKYGLGRQEGPFWGTLGVANGAFTLAYLQAEKLVFLLDNGILKVSEHTSFNIRTAHKLFWSLFAFVGFIRSLRALHISAQVLKSPHRKKCSQARFTQDTLLTTKQLLDVIHAVSWLPHGWLWGSRLDARHASGLATLSAAIGIVIYYYGKMLQ